MGCSKSPYELDEHGISFSDAVSALEDEQAIKIEDEHPYEQRFITICSDAFGRLLVVVYSYRGDVIDWFRRQTETQGGGNYQTMINQVLREYVLNQREPLEETLRRVIREELKNYH